jgi:hypothetical protein
MLEECPGSSNSVKVKEPHFAVFPEFKDASYTRRYQLFLTRLVRERLYDATCLLLSPKSDGVKVHYKMMAPELDLYQFVSKLHGHVVGHLTNLR